jgi:hypothetical protein
MLSDGRRSGYEPNPLGPIYKPIPKTKMPLGLSPTKMLSDGRRSGYEPNRMMRWSDLDISFGPQDHPDTKLSDRNLPFVVKLPMGGIR